MSQVADILARKDSTVHTVDRETTVFDAIKSMVEKNVGSVIVTDGESISGILTERDYLRRIVLEGRTSRSTQVSEVMTARLICVGPSHSVEECMSIMTQQRIRHLPVMESDRLAGIVSIGDLVKHLSKEQASELRFLSDFVSGRYPA